MHTEPSNLEEIKAARLEGPRRIKIKLSDKELYNKIYGAWLGRCIGCLLGKPVEGWEKGKIESFLRFADAYPLSNYFPYLSHHKNEYKKFNKENRTLLGNINSMVRDDDIDYTILGLHILEEVGLNFTTNDVGSQWLAHLPFLSVYTAERIAYKNLVNGIEPPKTATYKNPYKEWIGAQIRADIWGYVSPGLLEAAAGFAYRDASLSHIKNGIYGEMWVAAMISASFTTSRIDDIIQLGLTEIPRDCKLSKAIHLVVEESKKNSDWEKTYAKINKKYGWYNPVHTINNATIIAMGLLHSGGNFERAICITVMGGWDTDCNGATVGSIMGTILGAEKIPKKWSTCLNDLLETDVVGIEEKRISAFAERTHKIAKKHWQKQKGG
ncbi:MAG: ADP-ribosylglycohydrolase family protein [Candidatus Edwardsbacteria bacterium]